MIVPFVLVFIKEAMRAYVRHMGLMVVFDAFIPKHHLLFHLLYKSRFQGNPTQYATWLDESLNKTLKAACKNASVATFESGVLLRMRDLLKKSRGAKRPL
jgi:hypothetical protein